MNLTKEEKAVLLVRSAIRVLGTTPEAYKRERIYESLQGLVSKEELADLRKTFGDLVA
jgi:hypothetical protein